MSNLGFGFLLMLVGMVTVFVILLIVIYGSQLLIAVVNKIAPTEAQPARNAQPEVAPATRAVLEQAVAQITGGKGHITNITKIG